MHDYPETAKFLSDAEKREVTSRLKLDRSSLADEYDVKYFWHALQDWKIWVHMFITIGIYTPLYSISLFMPTIVRGLGYTDNVAQLMTVSPLLRVPSSRLLIEAQVPPYVVACVFCIGGGFLADRMKTRGVFMIGFCLVAYVAPSKPLLR